MLQIKTKGLDICRISKILVKYNINANITNELITLDGELSDDLLSDICNSTTICTIQNFKSETTQNESIISNVEELNQKDDESIYNSTSQDVILKPRVVENYDLIYSTVKRGEVYFCDFGEPYGSEQGYQRYAIVIQNNLGNQYAPTTIVLCCTTERKKNLLPVHHEFVFSNENMLDYNLMRIGSKQNIVMAEQIRTIDKARLRKYLGTMTPEFMDKMQEIIDVSLDLKRSERVITKVETVYVDKPKDPNEPKVRKDLNMVQIKLLTMVNIEELFEISKQETSDEIKTKKILELFGFDMQKNGVQYLFQAIINSSKDAYFNLETLCEIISVNESNIEKEEIRRLIVARVKERFQFIKSPTIDFIRLVNTFLVKNGGYIQ